uniref:Microsomal glutathione S-transferase 1 n=1 Tax=Ciona intestinalis TaxID=7719 RepID=F6Z3Z5_CIOIN
MSAFTLENEAFSGLVFYGGLCLAKTAAMSMVTAYHRITKGAMPTEEDTRMMTKDPEKMKKMLVPNDDVERVRRCHLNDIENIIPFVIIGFAYILTDPAVETAIFHFQLFTGSRISHTFCYLIPIPQPSRFVFCMSGYMATLSMAFRTLAALY